MHCLSVSLCAVTGLAVSIIIVLTACPVILTMTVLLSVLKPDDQKGRLYNIGTEASALQSSDEQHRNY